MERFELTRQITDAGDSIGAEASFAGTGGGASAYRLPPPENSFENTCLSLRNDSPVTFRRNITFASGLASFELSLFQP
jgi:hypothetical protein